MFFKGKKRANSSKKSDKNTTQKGGLSQKIQENVQKLLAQLGQSDDIKVRYFKVGELPAALLYLQGLVDNALIQDGILKPLLERGVPWGSGNYTPDMVLQYFLEHMVVAPEISLVSDWDKLVSEILTGDTIIFLEGISTALAIPVPGREQRNVDEPSSQMTIRGPREGFTETLKVNISLIRRRIRDPQLRVKTIKLGRRTKTDVAVVYIEGLVEENVLLEVNNRLNRIEIDGVLESGYIEQFIEESWWSPFPTMLVSERPDQAASYILEGRVVIITNNTPFILAAPATLEAFLQSPEDYYHRWQMTTPIRILRYLAAFISLVLPSLYIALTSFHPGMLPTTLVHSVAATREGVPFPAFIEALLMEIAIELLREAGIRLPSPLGQTIGIVGGLIIGEAAVNASIVSPIMVIVVALTTIASFTIPDFHTAFALRVLRFFLMMAAAFMGLYGVVIGLIVLLSHLAALKSFGISYLAAYSPSRAANLQDAFVRVPLPYMRMRPPFLHLRDRLRMGKKPNRKKAD